MTSRSARSNGSEPSALRGRRRSSREATSPSPRRGLGVGVIDPIHILHDRETGRSERVGEQKGARVGPVRRDARGRKLVMVIGRKGAAHDRAGQGEVDRELARDGRVLDVGDALRREQRREDVAVLAGLARGERGERPDRQAEIEADAVKVAGADAGTGQDQQTMLGQEFPQSSTTGEDRVRAAIHDRAAADFHHLQPGEYPDWATASDGTGEFAVEEGLAREWRSDVFDVVGVVDHDSRFLARGDDGADVLAGERAGQIAGRSDDSPCGHARGATHAAGVAR